MIVGMTDETPKPKRKRRRWIIAGVLLLFVAVAGWLWPRGDARFVGTWKWISADSESRLPIYKFRQDGTGSSQYSQGEPHPRQFQWRVHGGKLILYREQMQGVDLSRRFRDVIQYGSIEAFYADPYPYKIVRFANESIEIELEFPGHSPIPVMLTRIPE
jgi:hypothetical protein